MNEISYRYCHFPPSIVQHAVWLYCRFTLSRCRDRETQFGFLSVRYTATAESIVMFAGVAHGLMPCLPKYGRTAFSAKRAAGDEI